MRRPVLAVLAALVFAPVAHAGVAAYPSSQSIFPSGPLPPQGAARQIRLDVARGETEDAQIVVTHAKSITAAVEGGGLQPLTTRLLFAHFVRFGSKLVPDALMPWGGAARAAEYPNQPIWLQVSVPENTRPGTYKGQVTLTLDGKQAVVPVSVVVWAAKIPAFRERRGNLLAAFHVSPESYVNKSAAMFGFANDAQRLNANDSLFRFLAQFRISPLSFGFGDPTPSATTGYAHSPRWWLDTATIMPRQLDAAGGPFPAMRIPISNNRSTPRNYTGGQNPAQPEAWCGYLRSVRDFWAERGWLNATTSFVYGQDEPGPSGQRLVARQAKTTHSCFAGGRVLMTGNPTARNRYLWDNAHGDDVDIWTVLSRRYYGTFSTPRGARREDKWLNPVNAARAKGKTIWSYTYSSRNGSPGFSAVERLSDARVFMLWTVLEHNTGVLYGEGTTSYSAGNPLDAVTRNGDFVLLYPGRDEPVASARLEQIRDGIEDWSIYDVVRRRFGAGRVRAILGGNHIFSATRAKVQLACTAFCDLHSSTKFAWPEWSRGPATPVRIEHAKREALAAASR